MPITKFGGNTDSITVRLKNGATLTVNPMTDNGKAMDMALDLVALMGEGAFEAFGSLVNAVSAGVALGKGLAPNARILDGQALGNGLSKLARAVQERGGSAYIREWLTGGAIYAVPGGKCQHNLTDPDVFADRVNVPPDVILLALKLAIVANTRDFFGSAGQEMLGEQVLKLKDLMDDALSSLNELLNERQAKGE